MRVVDDTNILPKTIWNALSGYVSSTIGLFAVAAGNGTNGGDSHKRISDRRHYHDHHAARFGNINKRFSGHLILRVTEYVIDGVDQVAGALQVMTGKRSG
jgi:hypothetical protein